MTFRRTGSQTVTAFGAAGNVMRGKHERGEDAIIRIAGGGRRAVIAASVDCLVTGLKITEAGCERPGFEEDGAEASLPAMVEVGEPKGFWARARNTMRDLLGIRDDTPVPEQIVEKVVPGSTGYPRVDLAAARLASQSRGR